jgi:hypothetical protein
MTFSALRTPLSGSGVPDRLEVRGRVDEELDGHDLLIHQRGSPTVEALRVNEMKGDLLDSAVKVASLP